MSIRCRVLLEVSPAAGPEAVHRCCGHCRWPAHRMSPWRHGQNRDRNEHPWPCGLCEPGEPGRDRLR